MGSHLPRGTTGRHCLQGDHRETERKDGNPLTHSIQYIQIKQAKTHCSTVTPCLTSISPLRKQIFHKNTSTPTFDFVKKQGSHLPKGTTGRHCLQGDHRETERKDGNPLTHSIQYIQIKQAKTHCSTVTPCLTSISPLSSQIFHKNASTPTFDFVKKHNTTKTNR